MADHDDIWTPALQEAYASPGDVTVLCTLEFIHPAFLDEMSNPTGVRVIADPGVTLASGVKGRSLKLESTAPLDASTYVDFVAWQFNAVPIEQNQTAPGQFQIVVDDVAGGLRQYLDLALTSQDPIEVYYREYLDNDDTAPSYVEGPFYVVDVDTDNYGVKITGTTEDLINRQFPSKVYNKTEYRGLAQ